MENVYEVLEWCAWIYSAIFILAIVIFIVSQHDNYECSYEGYRKKRDFKNRKMNYFNFTYIPESEPGYYGHMKKDFKLLGSRNTWNKWTLAGLFIANPIVATIWLGTYLKAKKDYYIFIEDKQRSDEDYEINIWMDSELLKSRSRR